MKKVSCEICGSTDLIKNGDVFICQCCECRYSVEEVKKMVMDDKQQRKTLKVRQPIDSEQGAYGSSNEKKWICPECETINTETICLLCGYQKIADDERNDDVGKWKKLIIICSVFACIIAGVILSIVFSMRENENINVSEAPQGVTADVQVEATTVSIQETTAAQEETVPVAAEDMRNVLMEDPCKDLESDMYNKAFGGNIIRARIGTITFLDTLEEAPDASWDVSAAKDGSVLAWTEWTRDTGFGDYDLYIGAEGGVIAPENCDYLFAKYLYLVNINFNDAFNTENVATMKGMFAYCEEITTLDLSTFKTGKVTDMSSMFACDFAYGESGWTGVTSLMSIDISGFDTSAVTNMEGMFANCSQLTELDVSGFNTSNVTDMSSMFAECESITSLKVNGFDTSKVTDMSSMFGDCNSLTSLDVSSFNTSKTTDMSQMFLGCYKLPELDVTGFDTTNVTNMRGMFCCCHYLKTLDVSSFDTSKVTDMSVMFSCCRSLTELDISSFDTSGVTDMSSMFADAVNLRKLDLSGFDTSNVTDMWKMFEGCKNLRNLIVGEFDTSKVEKYESFMEDGKKVNGRPWRELFE